MAILYSYPETLELLPTDLLIGTSTIRVAGKKKNITKNFTLELLKNFILDGNIGVQWGTITGTLSNQTDLQSALNAKQNSITLTTTGSTGPATFASSVLNIPDYSIGIPTKTSDLINDGENGVNPFISALALTPYLLSTVAASTYFPIPTGTISQYIRGDGSLATFPPLTGYVPYTGATGAVNLGAYDLTVNGLTIGKGAGTGSSNTALGNVTLASSTTGYSNVAVGAFASNKNTTGNRNNALGYAALYFNTTGSYNTGIGQQALQANTTASSQTALGYQAGFASTAGNNVFLGYQAGNNLTTGYQGVYVGSLAQASGTNAQSEIVIGFNCAGKGTNTGFINPGSGPVYQGNNAATWSVTSDQRIKKNIVDNNTGLDVINKIKVRNFEYRLPEEITDVQRDQAIAKTGVQLGVIAQELQQILPECVKTESTGVMTVDANNLTWYLINAVKELSAEVASLKSKL